MTRKIPMAFPGQATKARPSRGKLAWAIVHKGGKIEVETVSETAGRCRDHLNLMDEEQGAKVRRVRVVPAWQ